MSSLEQIGKEGRTGSAWKQGDGERERAGDNGDMAQTMFAHMNKKNTIKQRKAITNAKTTFQQTSKRPKCTDHKSKKQDENLLFEC
jgi:hypothetical protein